MVTVLLMVATLVFGVASVLFLRWVLRYQDRVRGLAVWATTAGAIVLGGVVVLEVTSSQPLLGRGPRAILVVIEAVVLGFLAARVRRDMPLAGPVVAPIAAVVAFALWAKANALGPTPGHGSLGAITVIHIGAAVLGFLLFIPAYVLSVLFLKQEHRLKTKQVVGARMPSLMTLETNAWRLLYIGFPLYTVGILLGAIWSDSAGGAAAIRPQHIFAAASWAVYAFAIYRRIRTGWRGRRAALSLMAAFVATFGAVLMYMMR